MKQAFRKIISIIMSIVVLFSIMSFTVNMHYCGGRLVETAFFHNTKGCGMKMEKSSKDICSISKKNCCDDKQLVFEGQDELQLQLDKITFEQHIFIASFVHTYINLFEGLDNNVSSYEEYKPPLVVRQIFKIDEAYLV